MAFRALSERLSLKSPQDQAAAWSILARIASTGGGFASVLLVGLCLDGVTQGYFYTILALVAFLPLADFGVSYAAMQSASHEAPRLYWTSSGMQGEAGGLRAIAGLMRISQRLNCLVTAGATVVIGVFGTRALLAGSTPDSLGWAWAGILACASVTQLLSPGIAVREGAGRVREVWQLRLVQEIGGGVLLIAALMGGLGVYSLLVSALGRLISAIVWLGRADLRLPRASARDQEGAFARWRVGVWPFQWRVGMSALSGFFIYYLFTPVLLVTHGPIVAGQFGMTLAVANGIQNVTMAWLNSQAPHFGALIAAKDYSTLDQTFARTFRRATLLALTSILGAIAAFAVCVAEAPAFAAHLLPLAPFTLLMIAAFVNHLIFGLATYLRSHRRDPLAFVSVLGALAMSILVPWAAHSGTPTRLAGSYLALNLLGLCLALIVFITCRRRWHSVGKLDLAVSWVRD